MASSSDMEDMLASNTVRIACRNSSEGPVKLMYDVKIILISSLDP